MEDDINENYDIPVLDSSENATNTVSTPEDSSTQTSKKRAYPTKSVVWNHFTKEKGPDGIDERAKCNYCKKLFACPSSSGTSSLKRHLDKTCIPYTSRDKSQKLLSFKSVRDGDDVEEGAGVMPWVFDQDRARRELAIFIIKLELPFNIVDKDAFRDFIMVIQPRLKVISRTTIRKELLNIYGEEKLKLKRLIGVCHRVSLTADMWTSNQTLGYLCLTTHFIDDNWKLHKKILNFCMVPAPHGGDVIANAIELCLIDWNISKLSTITLDNASNNTVAVRTLVPVLSRKVQDGLNEIKESVDVIRESVKYVRGSQARKQLFEECILQERLSSKRGLCIDVATRWNSTFLMLESALQFESAFTRLQTRDAIFAREAPSVVDWKNAKVICRLLKVFYDATKLFSGHKYTTANLYFHEVFAIQEHLLGMAIHEDVSINQMTTKMQSKFDKYWRECNVMLAIAVVLDPRYKLKYLSFMYHLIYATDEAESQVSLVKYEAFKIYDEYVSAHSSRRRRVLQSVERFSEVDSRTSPLGERRISSLQKQFFKMSAEKNDVGPASELERYLQEENHVDDPKFDILSWWKINSSKYPILSQMARDILSIPVSTVASESAFNTGGRVLDKYRSSMSPGVVQALVCTQDWLRAVRCDGNNDEEIEVYQHDNDIEIIESGLIDSRQIP
ncbi:zinc finger BED domain-containing protein RICESLEEPER 2-like [Tasmannia lanceolata]|uniref:zinc finger BED domain-containing protein RICESLEEPER 2-like n=1 Tax=Tasmannia lanceolata TaxID=3420 RepID=UPI0040645D50